MNAQNTWELPFSTPAELELHAEWGNFTLQPVEPGGQPRLELLRGSSDNIDVLVEKHGDTVRVSIEPRRDFNWFGAWDCKTILSVPADIHAHVQTSAGSVSVRDLDACELGIKANAGKIDMENVHGVLHLAADAGSISGRDVGGYLNIEAQAGSVRLEVSELQPGDHRVRAAMGSVRLQLAKGLDVCIEAHTQMGSVRNSYPSRESAPAKLHLSTEMGSLRIEEGGFVMSTQRAARPATPPAPSTPPPAPTPPSASAPSPPPSTEQAKGAEQAPAAEQPKRAEQPADQELERILKMVEAGELSAQEADELLQAMGRA